MTTLRSLPVPAPRRRRRKVLALTSLGLAGLLAGLLSGCSNTNSGAGNELPSQVPSYAAMSGNWKFTNLGSSHLSVVSGALAVSGTAISGTLHAVDGLCAAAASAPFNVSGSIAPSGLVSIASTNFSAGILTVTGTLATDDHSLTEPTFTVTGGACATPETRSLTARNAPSVTAQQFEPLTGNYQGTFTDDSGGTLDVAASLSQPTAPDSNGIYHLTGYASFANNSCLNTPVVTDSTVSGDAVSATYTDATTGNTVTGNGTFSADAKTLTITNWILTGNCGSESGAGLLARQ